jgi:TM2 domain-containing membrane protein YozV
MSENVTKGLDEQYCSSCGSIIKIAAEICPKCGVRHKTTAFRCYPNASEKSRMAALLFCVFLGATGAHRFYTKPGFASLGTLQFFLLIAGTLFVLLGVIGMKQLPTIQLIIGGILFAILGIFTLVDFIFILVGEFKDGEGKKVLNW